MIADIEKSMDDVTDIAVHAIAAVKKHSIMALPDLLKIFKDMEDLMKELKLSLPEAKTLQPSDAQELFEKAMTSFQKIIAVVQA